MVNLRRLTTRGRKRGSRSGMALLMSLFVVFFVTAMAVLVLDTEMIQMSAHRNVKDYERALYLANAGVHHVLAELVEDPSWRGTLTDGAFPGDDTYEATAVDDTGGLILVTGTGAAGDIQRSVEVSVVTN